MNANLNRNDKTQQITRRKLIRYLLSFSIISTLAGVLTPIFGYLWPSASGAGGEKGGLTLVGTVDDIPVGHGKVIPVGNKPVIVVNTEQGIRVFSAICTHLACVVQDKDPSRGYIWCTCHDGRFNPLTGAVIGGPPPRPLPPYEFVIEGNQIYVGKPLSSV
jgi:nitrite reductase/ring-hydroxylating ferredoxin subunit